MQEEVKKYGIFVNGGPTGYGNNRAQIFLSGDKGQIAWVRFHDPGMTFPKDDLYRSKDSEIIKIHLPTSMFQNVLDILRNEKPVYVEYSESTSSAMLSFYSEEVGEGEIKEVP